MRKNAMIVLLCISGVLCLAAAPAALLRFTGNGFSIAPLEDTTKDATYQALSMSLPPSGGFAPNVSVQIQVYAGSLDDYAALSKQQLEQMKMKMLKESKPDKSSVLWEYSGEIQQRPLHFYAKAVMKPGRVYLATAAATEEQWKAASAKLIACVESLTPNKAAGTNEPK